MLSTKLRFEAETGNDFFDIDYSSIRKFYNQLEDEESRFIFRHRIEYLFTGDIKYLYEMTENANKLFHPAKTIRNISCLSDRAEEYHSGAVIYSVGEASEYCFSLLKDEKISVRAFCDPGYQKWRQNGYLGVPVISPDEMISNAEYKECAVVMSNAIWQKTNCDFLISNGFKPDRIFVIEGQYNFTNYAYRPSYFQQEFIKPVDDEIYVDAGCYNGKTIKQFSEFCEGGYSKIYGFEPHPESFDKTVRNIQKWGLPNTRIVQMAAWGAGGEFPFVLEFGTGAEGARIMDSGGSIVQTATIDEIVGGERVTFIKLDVEGAELEALKGAKDTIRRCRPRLAVCLYHKPEDIIEIPAFIYALAPDYKFYIRHHNYIKDTRNVAHNTVLYAV